MFRSINLLLIATFAFAGCDRIEVLESQVAALEETTSALQQASDQTSESVGRNTRRISDLETQLAGNTLFFVNANQTNDWFDVYANQSGRDLRVNIQMVCKDRTSRCLQLESQTSIRVLGILVDENERVNEFPVVENTVVVDTGPLDLSAVGAVRELVVPKGFRVIARTDVRGVRLRVFLTR
ncbi:hypothetical protein [Shimia sagamensis]|uniref:Uncharacterized protein n=1 Tax=Shimia sagamensis TaxID=1566352 RepID=A0ABY1PDS8_9RHOB|nr:hypothetical protein [Shimia sagamensis]SMP31622.1 hypothetical protein SAMN06265373_10821 [Shimia sagamensis]